MMRYLILSSLALSPAFLAGQSPSPSIVGVLQQVEQRNLALIAARAQQESDRVAARTGLNPSDPHASYDWLNGSPSSAGVQTEFSVFQSLDFPTAYGQKRKIAGLEEARADIRYDAARRAVLLEAQQVCLALIHLQRRQLELERRLASAQELERAATRKLETGEGHAIDANRARLAALAIRTDLRENEQEMEAERRHLDALNGGQPIPFSDTLYGTLPASLPPLEALEPVIEAADPTDRELQGDVALGERNIALSRALALPDLEAGYRYQAILGQTYNGFHAGMSIPLWEHRNTVRRHKLTLTAAEAALIAHRNEHRVEVAHMHARAAAAMAALREYQEALGALPDRSLLEKAQRSGEISAVQYQLEIAAYYAAQDRLLELEHEAHQALAELFAHEL